MPLVTIAMRWPRAQRRTLVIEDSLWTLSNERLQSNDLATLDITATVDAGTGGTIIVNTATVTCTVGGGFGNEVSADSEEHSVDLFQPAVSITKSASSSVRRTGSSPEPGWWSQRSDCRLPR